MPSTRQVSGARAERRVRLHYRLRGYRVLAANVRAGGNELDVVVVRRGRRLVFWEAVGHEKERRLRRAAEVFLARNRALAELEVAFEVAAVRGRRIERVPLG
jgi:Holliday junction resolvase-like predicted endonuclease